MSGARRIVGVVIIELHCEDVVVDDATFRTRDLVTFAHVTNGKPGSRAAQACRGPGYDESALLDDTDSRTHFTFFAYSIKDLTVAPQWRLVRIHIADGNSRTLP